MPDKDKSPKKPARRASIRRALRILGWSTVAIAVIGVLMRAGIVASKTDGGLALIADHVVGVLPPWKSFGGHDQTLSAWRVEQAERLLDDPQATAADCMAAAFAIKANGPRRTLASPQQIGRVMFGKSPDPTQIEFSSTGRYLVRSQRLAAKATELEPENKSYWRLRAVLLSDDDAWRLEADEQWSRITGVLQSASKLDPDNALYDYLLGSGKYDGAQKWISKDGPEGEETVLAFDPQLFDESRQHYESALAKSKVADGFEASQTIAAFLQNSPGSILCKLNCIDGTDVEGRRWNLTRRLDEPFYPSARAEAELAHSSEQSHLWFLQQNFGQKITAQYGENPPAYWGLSSNDQRLQAAVQTWMQDMNVAQLRKETSIAWSVFAVAASLSAWFLLAISAIAALAKLVLHRPFAVPVRGVGLPVFCWIIAFGTTFTAWMFLARLRYQIAGRQIMFWTIVAISVIALAAFFWFATRFVLRQGKKPPAQRSKLFHPARLALAIGGTFVILVPLLCVVDAKIRRSIAYNWHEISNIPLVDVNADTRLAVARDTLADSILQWVLHFGIEWTLAVWIILFASAAWLVKHWRRSERSESVPSATWRDRVATGMSYLARSAIPVIALLFLLSIAAATQWVVCLQSQHDEQLARLANLRWMAEGIEAVLKTLPAAPAAAPDGPLGESDGEPQPQ